MEGGGGGGGAGPPRPNARSAPGQELEMWRVNGPKWMVTATQCNGLSSTQSQITHF